MELNGWISPQTLPRHGTRARSGSRVRRSHDHGIVDPP
jgi:hypothetical protein